MGDEISRKKLIDGIMDDVYVGRASQSGQVVKPDEDAIKLEEYKKRMTFEPDSKTKRSKGGNKF